MSAEDVSQRDLEKPELYLTEDFNVDGLAGCAAFPEVAATIIGGMGAGPAIFALCSAVAVSLG